MAGSIHRLNDKQVKNAKKDLNDGGNLWLLIKRDTKVWAFRYMLRGKARKAGLGSYPSVSLAEARSKAAEYRKWIAEGIDPIEHNNRRKSETHQIIPTFTESAARFILTNRHQWKNRKHARQWVATIKTYARPKIGASLVSDITTEQIEDVLRPIWNSKTETAKRVQGRIERIIDWAIAKQYRTSANPARWANHLDQILPSPNNVKKQRNGGNEAHLAAMPYQELPRFFKLLEQKDSNTSCALQFLILTACRTNEVLNATWYELDIQNKAWLIPASRMKAGKEHRVPLTEPMLRIIESRPKLNQFIFPGNRLNKPLSNMTMLNLMRTLGYKKDGPLPAYVPHGFRSSFRDWCEEESNSPHGVIERALAHAIPNATERAYNRSDLFEKRRSLMETWGTYVTSSLKE